MNKKPDDLENRNLNRLVLVGIIIGFFLALTIFGVQYLIQSGRTANALLPSPTTPILTPTVKEATPPVSDEVVLTPTPVLLQFDQMWAAVGDPAPFFTLSSLEGEEISLADFKGKPIIINFWASWCEPCGWEMPGLESTYQKYKESGLVILGINAIEKDDPEKVADFVADYHINFPILLDQKDSPVSALYGINGLPASYFIDSSGVLRRIQIGAMLPEVMEKYTLEILAAQN